jgi:hypothetical protein
MFTGMQEIISPEMPEGSMPQPEAETKPGMANSTNAKNATSRSVLLQLGPE